MTERISRRGFVERAAGLGLLAWAGEALAFARTLRAAGAQEFWPVVRSQFTIPPDRIYLNVGTLGAQPRVVVDAVVEHTRRVAETFPPGVDREALRGALGALVGGDPAGFTFPRNTTEGMNFVANGLELGAGDEILTTDHEHIGGLCCWQLIAARRGATLRQLPLPPADGDELVAVFERALTARTRVVSVSHVNFTNGVIMPVARLAELCRPRGIILVVDGAHPPGLMPVDIASLGADFYASSPHKWLLAPQGTGFLWMAEPWRTRLWPTLASGGWDDTSLGAHRFDHLGTSDDSRLAGLAAAIAFHDAIGTERIAGRIRALRSRLRDGLAGIPGIRFTTPAADDLAAGMIAFQIEGMPSLELQARLADVEAPPGAPLTGRVRIRTRVIGEYGYDWMRLSPHVWNDMDEIDTAVACIAQAARGN